MHMRLIEAPPGQTGRAEINMQTIYQTRVAATSYF